MAVKVNNTANIRKAQRWSEKDDAALLLLLKKKINDINIALRESDSPFERSRLKELKKHYKTMCVKVQNGVYNGDILFSELKASAALQAEYSVHSAPYATTKGAKKYIGSYDNMDFDFETAFRKKRYYGASLPVVLLLLSIVFVMVFIMSAFIPTATVAQMEKSGISLNSFFSVKLGDDTVDIEIDNTETTDWPSGTFAEDYEPLKKGEVYTDSSNNVPDRVRLHADLGMTSVYISPFDIVKAWFYTPMLETTRLDFLEDNALFQGTSYYYLCFLSGSKSDALVIQKDEDGNFDRSVIFRHIGTYGTIIMLIASFILGVINVLINIIRLFTYTSRKLHIVSLLSFLATLFMAISPALATIEGTDLGGTFKAYFSALTSQASFLENTEATVGIGLLILAPVLISFVMMIMPLFFRNRLKRRPTFVPKGNKQRAILNDPAYSNEETYSRVI